MTRARGKSESATTSGNVRVKQRRCIIISGEDRILRERPNRAKSVSELANPSFAAYAQGAIKQDKATVLIDPATGRSEVGIKEFHTSRVGEASEIRSDSREGCSAQTSRIAPSEKERKNSSDEIISPGRGTGSD